MKRKDKNIIKCKLCGWQTPRFTMTKEGKRKHGYSKLVDHWMMKHPDEFIELQKDLEREETE